MMDSKSKVDKFFDDLEKKDVDRKGTPIYKQIRESVDRSEMTKYPETGACPISQLVADLIVSVGTAHMLHLNTRNWETHKWLDVYYKEMPEKIDAFAEALIGTYGSNIPNGKLPPEACGCPFVLIAKMIEQAEKVHKLVVKENPAVIAPLEEVISFIAKCRYLSLLQ